METRTINVYKYSELSEKAQERARYDDAASGDWCRESEYMASIKALAEHFGGRVVDYSIDWTNSTGPSSMTFEMPERENAESKAAWDKWLREKLAALGSYNRRTLKGNGDCKLTGCGTDENAIDGFRLAFMRGKERDLNALMQAAFDTWIEAAWADYAYDYGEGYAETAEANDWRYTKDGKLTR